MIMFPMARNRPQQKPGEQVQTVVGNLRRLVALMWRLAPGLLAVQAVLHLAQAAVPAVQIFLTRALVDAAAAAIGQGPGALAPAYRLLAIQAGLLVAQAGLRALQHMAEAHLQRRASYHLDGLVADKAARVPLVLLDQPEYHDQLRRAGAGFGIRGAMLVQTAMQLGQGLVTVLAYLAILARFHWLLAVGLIVLAGPALLVQLKGSEWRFWQARYQTPSFRRLAYLYSLLQGRDAAKELRVFGLAGHLREGWRRLFWQNAGEQLALDRKLSWSRLGTEGLAGVAGTGAGGFLLWLGAAGRLTLGDYVALAQALLSAMNMLQMTGHHLGRMYEDALFTSDLFAFLALPEEPPPADPRPFPVPLRQGIAVKDLAFSYPGSPRPVLADISFHIRPGEKVAIVGENGAGKTTLVKCLIGLYQPQAGSIRYDGTDVGRFDPAELRRNVTAIFQDFVRYQLTARENIGYGRVEAMGDAAALARAAELGGADEVVTTLEQGYDTELGPTFAGGKELSYGQWQKFALSRAFFRDADVIVLDEPTAALDPRAEAAVFDRFAGLAAGKTALLISHRLGTCRSADRILVLKDGRLAETGTHDELVALGGEYARMFGLQARWYV